MFQKIPKNPILKMLNKILPGGSAAFNLLKMVDSPAHSFFVITVTPIGIMLHATFRPGISISFRSHVLIVENVSVASNFWRNIVPVKVGIASILRRINNFFYGILSSLFIVFWQ